MNEKTTAFHLSAESKPVVQSDGNYLIAAPAFIFNHRQKDSLFLHQIEFDENDIVECFEDGHHDMASSFSIDEYYLVKDLSTIRSWKLDIRDDQNDLLSSDFYQSCRASLFSPIDSITSTIIDVSNDEVAQDFILSSKIEKSSLWSAIPSDRVNLKLKLVKDEFFSEEQVASYYSIRTEWADLAEERQDQLENSFRLDRQFNYTDPFLFEYFDTNKNIQSKALKFVLFMRLYFQQKQTDLKLFEGERFSLPVEAIVFFLRRFGEDYTLQLVDSYLELKWSKQQLRYLIDRAVVFDAYHLIESLRNHFSEWTDEIDCWSISSELATKGVSSKHPTLVNKIRHLQSKSNQMSIPELAEIGFIQSLKEAISKKTDKSELNKALLKASEKGYTAIVEFLHSNGADLSFWSNFSIKYANKFSYKTLKEFLIEHDIEDVSFS